MKSQTGVSKGWGLWALVGLTTALGSGAGCGGPRSGHAVHHGHPSEVRAALADAPPPLLTVGEDVTARFLAMNAETMRPPPSVFRSIPVQHIGMPPSVEQHGKPEILAAPPANAPEPQTSNGVAPHVGVAPQVHVAGVLPTPTRSDAGWRVHLPSGAPVVTPTVHQGSVIVSGGFQSRQLYAFDARTGDPRWGIQLGDDGPSTPACDDGVCVFNTESCTIFAVDAETGAMLWSAYLGDPLMSAPSIADGVVFTSFPIRGGGTWPDGEDRPTPQGASHALGAFDLRTGEMKWARWIDAEVMSAPVLYRGQVYAATFGGTMFHFDAGSGELVSARTANATAAPALIDGALYFSRRENEDGESFERIVRSGGALLPEGAAAKPDEGGAPAAQTARRRASYLRHDFQADGDYMAESQANDSANGFSGGAPAAANATVALALIGRATVHGLQEFQGSWVLGVGGLNLVTMGEAVVAFDRQTGAESWVVSLPGDLTQLGGSLGAPPARAGAHIVVPTTTGQVWVFDDEGTVTRRLDVGSPLRTQAVVDSGMIYVGTADGNLVALNTGDASMTGWPAWAGNAARTGL